MTEMETLLDSISRLIKSIEILTNVFKEMLDPEKQNLNLLLQEKSILDNMVREGKTLEVAKEIMEKWKQGKKTW